jgi:hypothetical protein
MAPSRNGADRLDASSRKPRAGRPKCVRILPQKKTRSSCTLKMLATGGAAIGTLLAGGVASATAAPRPLVRPPHAHCSSAHSSRADMRPVVCSESTERTG